MARQNTKITVQNLFTEDSSRSHGEDFLTLFHNGSVRVERIVSRAHASPPGFWYDQEDDEWVIVLRGSATIEFEEGQLVEMNAGDYLTIAAHVRHRVARTDNETIWLAVHAPAHEVE
jgi:cupin 2 domain-containing protein